MASISAESHTGNLGLNSESLMYKLDEVRIISGFRPRHSYQFPLDESQITLEVVSCFQI